MAFDKSNRKRGRAAVEDRARIMRRDGGLCQSCLERGLVRVAHEIDHTVPLFKGGSDTDDNKRALCSFCHKTKTREDLGHKQGSACDVKGMPVSQKHHWNKQLPLAKGYGGVNPWGI